MAPKKNGKSTNKKKKQEKNNPNNKTTEWDELDIPQLEQVISNLTIEYQTSIQNRIKIQTEHDIIYQSYYEATKQNVHKVELQIKAKEMEIEDRIYDQNIEIQSYNEKQQYIQYNHEQKVMKLNNERIQSIQDEIVDHKSKITFNEQKELTLKMEMKEREIVYYQQVKNKQNILQDKLNTVRDRLDAQLKTLRQDCINTQIQTQQEMDMKKNVELREVTEQNNLHLHQLDTRHGELYDDTKLYYTNVSNGNMIRIQRLNDDLRKVEQMITNYDNQSRKFEQENERLSGPLSECLSQVSNNNINTINSLFHILPFYVCVFKFQTN